MIARCNKVIISAQAVLADGGLVHKLQFKISRKKLILSLTQTTGGEKRCSFVSIGGENTLSAVCSSHRSL